jgi:hypothetical protein
MRRIFHEERHVGDDHFTQVHRSPFDSDLIVNRVIRGIHAIGSAYYDARHRVSVIDLRIEAQRSGSSWQLETRRVLATRASEADAIREAILEMDAMIAAALAQCRPYDDRDDAVIIAEAVDAGDVRDPEYY